MIIIIMAIITLFQSIISPSAFATGSGNTIIYFPNNQEICLFELESRTSKSLATIKETGFEVDFDSVKIIDGEIFFSMRNESNAKFSYVPKSRLQQEYQVGTIYYKDYLVDMDGNYNLVKTTEIVALSPETIEIRETYNLDGTGLNNPQIRQVKNQRKTVISGEEIIEVAEKNGIKLIVDKRSLFIQKKESESQLLIKIPKKTNLKVLCGCYNPFINTTGTKGLCSYFSYPWGKQKDDKSTIIEIDLASNQITKHKEIVGLKPSFSLDDRFILYKSMTRDQYEVFNVQDKTIIKLPKSKHALWVN